jgi:hypothetical protein
MRWRLCAAQAEQRARTALCHRRRRFIVPVVHTRGASSNSLSSSCSTRRVKRMVERYQRTHPVAAKTVHAMDSAPLPSRNHVYGYAPAAARATPGFTWSTGHTQTDVDTQVTYTLSTSLTDPHSAPACPHGPSFTHLHNVMHVRGGSKRQTRIPMGALFVYMTTFLVTFLLHRYWHALVNMSNNSCGMPSCRAGRNHLVM